MTTRQLVEVDSLALFFFAIVAGYALANYMNNRPHLPTKIQLPVMQDFALPTPTPTPNIEEPQTFTQISPDGTKLLTMTVTPQSLSKMYSFSVSNADNTDKHNIYSATYSLDTMSIPFNTWSPDNNYVFLQIASTSATQAIVLSSSGQPLTQTDYSLNVTNIFNEKVSGGNYYQTTGWASNTLLIITTKNSDGSEGTSYWFEVPTQAIIPLSTQF